MDEGVERCRSGAPLEEKDLGQDGLVDRDVLECSELTPDREGVQEPLDQAWIPGDPARSGHLLGQPVRKRELGFQGNGAVLDQVGHELDVDGDALPAFGQPAVDGRADRFLDLRREIRVLDEQQHQVGPDLVDPEGRDAERNLDQLVEIADDEVIIEPCFPEMDADGLLDHLVVSRDDEGSPIHEEEQPHRLKRANHRRWQAAVQVVHEHDQRHVEVAQQLLEVLSEPVDHLRRRLGLLLGLDKPFCLLLVLFAELLCFIDILGRDFPIRQVPVDRLGTLDERADRDADSKAGSRLDPEPRNPEEIDPGSQILGLLDEILVSLRALQKRAADLLHQSRLGVVMALVKPGVECQEDQLVRGLGPEVSFDLLVRALGLDVGFDLLIRTPGPEVSFDQFDHGGFTDAPATGNPDAERLALRVHDHLAGEPSHHAEIEKILVGLDVSPHFLIAKFAH